MFFGITVCLFVFVVTGSGATDIALSNHSVVLSKVLFVICKHPSCSDNASILSVLLELVLVLLSWYSPHVFCLLFNPTSDELLAHVSYTEILQI